MLSSFLNMCIPDGCTFSPNVCSDGACFNESIGQHLSEKSQLFTAIVELQIFIVFAVFLVLSFISDKYIEDKKQIYAMSYANQRLLYPFSGINYLIEAFSRGIVNPKIF
ncbi:MAG: hypothetical protein Q8O66_00920 [bacterium]|nr:hypothetical protein [bacterium]